MHVTNDVLAGKDKQFQVGDDAGET